MQSDRSIKKLYFIILISISYLGIGILGVVSIKSQYSIFLRETNNLRTEYIASQKTIVKTEVERALDFIEYMRSASILPEKELQKEILEWFSNIRFQNRGNEPGILFARSYEGILLMSVSTKELVGEDLSLMLDPDGINTHQLFMETVKEPEGGYAQYSWYNPSVQAVGNKISFIKAYPDWHWYIGAGFWLDDINSVLDQKTLELKHHFSKYMILIFITMLILLIIIYICVLYISKRLDESFSGLASFFQKASLGSTKLDIETINFTEFKQLGTLANQMMEERQNADEMLQISNKRFQNLFDNAPISLWEEDFTDLLIYLNEQLDLYKTTPEILFEEHPEILINCSDLVKVIDVNKQTLKLFEAKSKEELLGKLSQTFTDDSIQAFKKSVISFYNQNPNIIIEAKNKSLKGKELDVLISWSCLSKPGEEVQRVIVSLYDTSEIRTIENELKESEMRFRAIFENNHFVMLLINPENGQIIDANPAALNFYGYSYNKFITEIRIQDINISDPSEIKNNLKKATIEGKVFFNFKHKLSDGTTRDVEVYSGKILINKQEFLFSIIHDVTEKQKAKLELELSKNKLESIFRAAPTGIGVVSNRIFTEVNQTFCDMTGYSAQELIGKESRMIYPSQEEFERVGIEKYEQIQEKGTGTIETKLQKKNGQLLDVLMSSTPMDMDDLNLGVTFTALDITQEKKNLNELEKYRYHLEELVKKRTNELESSQNALLKLVDDLNKQSEKLDIANRKLIDINHELETFSYSVSHDLKAPLRGIDGYSQLLLEDYYKELSPEAQEFLKNIQKGTLQMNTLIEDLLAYSRIERQDFHSNQVKFKSIVDDLLQFYSGIIKSQKIKIKFSIPKSFNLVADQEALKLVMRNLIDNAIKFSAQKKETQIEIGAKENDRHWILFIKDNGIGFNMKYHDRIFKIFQRLHLPEDYEGTGVGLAIVSKAVTRMNGRIWAESVPNEGTCFYIEINKT
ncbi:MAG: PAS domain S-box protein [Bacteroidales bacterium]|nr:PAS domain S-box protein [Bacteroidales bacterium]MCF8390729.1 PAS domain S-box protein [Bacteroidales bacterium]